ncbi:MAG TPA: nicotinate-nucleotide--dimethylbenzimidazole phosphoribosyltransferase [Actinocrinis sp.]|nr:nicotinate-nucleotide--dimethylbenzimidazole phosphoribosyltransferase [Actinocrinis sp.]
MSGTEEFGNGGYGTGEFDRAGAEAGPGAAAHTAPATGPRVPGTGVPHQGPAAGGDATAGAGAGTGAGAGAPWLAAGGSVPYAEAVFGAAGQGDGTGQRAVGAGRRGVPDVQQRPAAGSVGAQVPPPRAQQGPGSGSGDVGYGGEAYGEGYVNGYGSRAGGVAQVPQQRFDASPFDSGFTQQGRRFDPREQSRPGSYEAVAGGQQPQQPGQAGQPSQPGQAGQTGQSGFERGGYDPAASGIAPGAGFERQGYESGAYEQAGPPPGFDAPTTEFRPGPMFDEPTVRPGAPAAAPSPNGQQQPQAGAGAGPGAGVQGAPGGLNGRGSVFASRQAPVNGAPQAAGPAASGTTQRPSMSGPGTWTAAPPPAQQGSASPAQGPAGAAQEQQPAQDSAQPVSAGGSGQVPLGQPSISGIPRVPSPTAAGARPAVPDEPLPAPPPLPTRPPRAERQAQQAAQAQARNQGTASAQQAAAQRETLTPPRRPVGMPQQPQPQAQPQAQAQTQQQAQQSQQAQAQAQQQPQQAPGMVGQQAVQQPAPQQEPAADDLSSERLRSVAPVPASRGAVGENPAATAARPGSSGSFDALAEEDLEAQGSDGDETVAVWQAPSADAGIAGAQQQSARPGTGQVPLPTQPHQQGPNTVQPNTTPQNPAQPHTAPQQASAQVAAGVQSAAPSRAEAAAASRAGVQPPGQQHAQPQSQVQSPPQAAAVAQTPNPAPQNSVQAAAAAAAAQLQHQQAPAQAGAAPTAAAPQQPQQSPPQTSAPTAAAPASGVSASAATAAAGPAAAAAARAATPAMPPPRGTRRRVAESASGTAPATPAPGPAVTEPANASASTPAQTPAGPQRAVSEVPAATSAPAASSPAPKQTAAGPGAARPVAAATDPRAAAPHAAAQQSQHDAGDDAHRAPAYEDDALAAVYRVIHERRDVRNDFLPDEFPTETLTRILEAAHTAPSVGFSQPWDFLVIRDEAMRRRVHDLAVRQRRSYAASLPKARARAFAALKIEAILDTPVNIVVTCDPTRGGRHTLGRYTQPMMAPFSSCLAVENLWLAARAEGLGVGWVSFFDERELAAVLDLPDHLQVVAYLCVGYVKSFPQEPELAGAGWAKRRPLAWAVHEERFGRRALPGAQPISLLGETVDAIRGLDPEALAAARDRQSRMTKPPGSLGVLEAVSEQLAGLAGQCPPPLPEPAALAVFAADHGVHAQGVTPWPQEVTAQMVANFLAGGAVVNAFAKQVGAEVCVVDVGVNAELTAQSGLIPRKVRYGTADMTQGPALTREEVVAALEAGIETARDLVAAGNRCLLTGDMGIANTTASAALIAAFTGASPAQVTGYGTGIDEQTYAHKVEVVRAALALHRPDPQDPLGVLAAFGGLEHAALAGFILGAAALRIPVLLDGVIAGAAALVAQALSPEVTVACVAGHRSAEPGHALALEALGITPLIDLELRLGEGSGAALALPLVGAAVRALREVATFDDAGVADASEASVLPPTERERT